MVLRIGPGSRVLDVGAGAQTTRRHLPANCVYIPLDLVARTPETIVCDLNKDTLPSVQVDWAVVSGVIEYVVDAPRFLAELASVSGHVVLCRSSPRRQCHGTTSKWLGERLLTERNRGHVQSLRFYRG